MGLLIPCFGMKMNPDSHVGVGYGYTIMDANPLTPPPMSVGEEQTSVGNNKIPLIWEESVPMIV